MTKKYKTPLKEKKFKGDTIKIIDIKIFTFFCQEVCTQGAAERIYMQDA